MNKFIMILLFLFTPACGHVTLERSATKAEVTAKQTLNINSYLFGLLTAWLPPESRTCPDGKLEAAEFYSTGGDVVLTIITLGLYIPHHATFECSGRRAR